MAFNICLLLTVFITMKIDNEKKKDNAGNSCDDQMPTNSRCLIAGRGRGRGRSRRIRFTQMCTIGHLGNYLGFVGGDSYIFFWKIRIFTGVRKHPHTFERSQKKIFTVNAWCPFEYNSMSK